MATNRQRSATGTGAVHVNAGTLGGTGSITGAVGTGSGSGACLSPGMKPSVPGALTIGSALAFNFDATYASHWTTARPLRTRLSLTVIAIKNGEQFSLVAFGNRTLATRTVFKVTDNTAATTIAGRFTNLADGSTLTSDRNKFQAS